MDDKVYTPEVIEEAPFPGEVILPVASPTQGTEKDTFTPTTTKEKAFVKKRTAIELLSTALNTRSRKILQEFELEQSGGIQVGNFKEGITGDLRITPNGITARDIAGLITFLLDATDGSALFKGTLQAGTLIGGGGKVFIEEVDGEGRIVINDGQNDRVLIGYQKDGF